MMRITPNHGCCTGRSWVSPLQCWKPLGTTGAQLDLQASLACAHRHLLAGWTIKSVTYRRSHKTKHPPYHSPQTSSDYTYHLTISPFIDYLHYHFRLLQCTLKAKLTYFPQTPPTLLQHLWHPLSQAVCTIPFMNCELWSLYIYLFSYLFNFYTQTSGGWKC